MQTNNDAGNPMTAGEFTDTMIRIGLIAITAFLCYRIFNPFMGLMVWALILAITLIHCTRVLRAVSVASKAALQP